MQCDMKIQLETQAGLDVGTFAGETFSGLEMKDDACGVSIMRGGQSAVESCIRTRYTHAQTEHHESMSHGVAASKR